MPGSRTTLPHALTILLTAPLSCNPDPPDGQVTDPHGCRTIILPADTTTGDTAEATGPNTDTHVTATTGVPECDLDTDCQDDLLCIEGACVYDPAHCGEKVLNVPIAANMVLLIDKSGSMVSNSWDDDNDPNTPEVTRWHSLHKVVEYIASTFDTSINLGLHFFPSLQAQSKYDAAACVVASEPEVFAAADNAETILAKLPPPQALSEIAGATPLRKGLITAIAHLKTLDDDLPKFITIITDGGANCSPEGENPLDTNLLFETYDQAVHQVVADAYTLDEIGVFVVGIDILNATSPQKDNGDPDNTNVFDKLNELALAGGYPKDHPFERFYNTINLLDLQASLTTIATQILPCTIPLDPPPKYPDLLELNIVGIQYPAALPLPVCIGDGWFFSEPDYSQITLCGAACTNFRTSGVITAQSKCPTE